MSDERVSVARLKEQQGAVYVDEEETVLPFADLLALVEAVEAAYALVPDVRDLAHDVLADVRPGKNAAPLIERLLRLEEALTRFDFGAT